MEITKNHEQFILWLRDISYALKQLQSDKEKLEYYKIKIIGYQGIKYGEVTSKCGNKNPYSHLLDKIDELENKLKNTNESIIEYKVFTKELKKDELLILDSLLHRKISMTLLAEQMKISRTTLYTLKNGIIEKWYTFHQQWINTNAELDNLKQTHEQNL